jgi:hypothetical protein
LLGELFEQSVVVLISPEIEDNIRSFLEAFNGNGIRDIDRMIPGANANYVT